MEYKGRGGKHKERTLRVLKEKNTSPPLPLTPLPLSVFLLARERNKNPWSMLKAPGKSPVYMAYIINEFLILFSLYRITFQKSIQIAYTPQIDLEALQDTLCMLLWYLYYHIFKRAL